MPSEHQAIIVTAYRMRVDDKETVEVAISAAQTGHLVLGTLHPQDAVRTTDRILDFFAPHERQIRLVLPESMVGNTSQQKEGTPASQTS